MFCVEEACFSADNRKMDFVKVKNPSAFYLKHSSGFPN